MSGGGVSGIAGGDRFAHGPAVPRGWPVGVGYLRPGQRRRLLAAVTMQHLRRLDLARLLQSRSTAPVFAQAGSTVGAADDRLGGITWVTAPSLRTSTELPGIGAAGGGASGGRRPRGAARLGMG